jgi:SAM-dependent methyltransferase
MDLATFDRLLTPEGTSALAAAAALHPTEARYPACVDRLQKHFSAGLARAALDTVLLREKARAKFTRADAMFFTREALEMATGEVVARYRADRFAGFRTVADLCCGIGGDAIGLAQAGCRPVGVDRDPLRVRMAEANLGAYQLSGRFVCADVLADDLPVAGAVFADPARRPGGRRSVSVDDYDPSLGALLGRFTAGHPIGVKVAPAIPRADLRRFDTEAEFISLGGELKECTLWFGPFKTAASRATVLPGPHTIAATGPQPSADIRLPQNYLYDPDPSVTRAGLVGLLATTLLAAQIDPEIGFLTSDNLESTPFATPYRIDDTLPFHGKRIGEWLRERHVGRVTIVKRGSAVDVDELGSKWKLRGDIHKTVILTRAQGKPVAIIGDRLA